MDTKSYIYRLPNDYTIEPSTRTKLDAITSKYKLMNEEAQEFVDLHVELVEEYAEKVGVYVRTTILYAVTITAIICFTISILINYSF